MKEWKERTFTDSVDIEVPQTSDEFKKLLKDSDNKEVKRSLLVTVKGTHAGRLTRNDTVYLPLKEIDKARLIYEFDS